jgi:hypothetical protein
VLGVVIGGFEYATVFETIVHRGDVEIGAHPVLLVPGSFTYNDVPCEPSVRMYNEPICADFNPSGEPGPLWRFEY